MPYVYEGDAPTRVNGVRYSPGATTDNEDVKGKSGFREVSDDEAGKIAGERAGTFADAKPDAHMAKVSDNMAWIGRATVAAPLNVVIGDSEAPLGPPSGTITTKQALMREGPAERAAFGSSEWLPEEADALKEFGESGAIQAQQAEDSGAAEEVANEYVEARGSGGGGEPSQAKQTKAKDKG